MKPDPIQLDYGTQPRRRRWRLWLMVILGIGVALFAGRLTQKLWQQWQHGRFMNAAWENAAIRAAPADSLIFGQNEDVPAVYASDWGAHRGTTGLVTGYREAEQRGWVLRPAVVLHGGVIYPGATAYARTHETAEEVLMNVLVHLHGVPDTPLPQGRAPSQITFTWHVVDQFDWRGNPKSPAVTGTVQLATWPDPRERRTRFYFGAADPADASRFSIRYEVGNVEDGFEEGFIDGKLEDDLTVTLTVRDGPLAK
jgi:hypothetical protein